MQKLLFVLIVVYLFIIGFWVNMHFTVDDAAIHAQSIEITKEQLYPSTYEPVTNIKFTYPPLFYYLGCFLTFFNLSALKASQLLGLLSFVLFPFSIYLLTKIWSERAALFAAIASTVSCSLVIVLLLSEYPQILAFDFLILGLYFSFSKRYILSGVFFGLCIITHPFMGFITAGLIFSFIIFKFVKERNNIKNVFKTVSISILISLIWLYQYILIFLNMWQGSWHNVKWYSIQGFGFVSMNGFWDMILRINPFIFFVSIFGLYFMIKKFKVNKEFSFILLFIFFLCLFFNIYHFPPAQYKFLDLWIIPITILFGIGCEGLIKDSVKKFNLNIKLIIIPLLIISSIFPFFEILEYHSNFSAISPKIENYAHWLGDYDKEKSRILLAINSSKKNKENLNFNSELIFSQISNKIPLDGTISDLEAYTPEYKEQLNDRETVINNFSSTLADKYKIKYIITNNCPSSTTEIYSEDRIRICQNNFKN